MPIKQITSINDSALTPTGSPVETARDFVPGGNEGNVSVFYNDFTGGTAAGKSKLTCSVSMPTPQRDTARIKYTLAIPFTSVVDGVEVTHHTCRAYCEFVIPAAASEDGRRDLKSLLTNAVGGALGGMVADLEDLY